MPLAVMAVQRQHIGGGYGRGNMGFTGCKRIDADSVVFCAATSVLMAPASPGLRLSAQ
jgi:hypothetical protein